MQTEQRIKLEFSCVGQVSNSLGGLGGGGRWQKSTFSKYGHVAHQIKGNEANNNMLVNNVPLHTSLTPWMGLKVHLFLF